MNEVTIIKNGKKGNIKVFFTTYSKDRMVMDSENFEFSDLLQAYLDCRRSKRNTLNALDFEYNLEENLVNLYNDLQNGTYEIGQSICFVVLYPKPREIWAGDFRDRVVHHLLYNALNKRFYNRFISTTFSCIPKRGTLHAAHKLSDFAQKITKNYTKDAYYIKADLKNFFVSINKDILYKEVSRYVNEEWMLKLAKQIIYHNPRNNVYIKSSANKFNLIPNHKSLWHTPNSIGLPIGNLTSQFFSNVYLNVLDQYVKHHLKCKYYCRYVDDFVMMSCDPKELVEWHRDLKVFLAEKLALSLHEDKKEINKIHRGIDFVGYVVKPHRTLLRQRTLKRVFKIIREQKNSPTWFDVEELKAFRTSINSYLGMMQNINQYELRKKICSECSNLFISGDSNFTKLVLKLKIK